MQALHSFRRIAFAALAIHVLAALSFAESFELRHARDLSSNPVCPRFP
jgi:hypothetical protein